MWASVGFSTKNYHIQLDTIVERRCTGKDLGGSHITKTRTAPTPKHWSGPLERNVLLLFVVEMAMEDTGYDEGMMVYEVAENVCLLAIKLAIVHCLLD